ncbi:SpaH/EbpB family LPXTG-anchored major pilin [Bifidobacterium sp. 64T4]|uniref:SpaH/EbpB family LPXTG-anchored major pilin n=1 Tax=Bifidobacterium pongonis TaxID=2834432 RepID=UPI001C5929B0|nr:SpaH/EbpB family LPXTG-anchored major pilin [Bifidobacterium pongonis]MBW3094281.1 SpaH/EbpB family LPXTG-anchored major pilin [Bifidobacterium pongonis]
MNKVLKGLVAVVSTAAMAIAGFAGAASATAAPDTTTDYKLTIKNSAAGHTYDAYQVFKGRISDSALVDIEWGDGVDSAALTATGAPYAGQTAAQVAESLSGKQNDSAEAKTFANNVAGKDGSKSYLASRATGTAQGTGSDVTISGLKAGYYLIKDSYTASNKGEAFTAYVLKVVGNVEAALKVDYPTVEKKVKENSSKFSTDGGYGAGYNDVADYNIGDQVPFKLIGTVPDMSRYTTYKYVFHDTASEGLTLPAKEGVKVYVADDKAGTSKADITASATVAVSGQNLTVSFKDLKTVGGVEQVKFIIVEYSATLNSNAVIGLDGNTNTVNLEYSNNPNNSGEGEDTPTDKTPDDKVIVFTYKLNGTKVDATDNNTTLKDAEFKLQNAAGSWAQIDVNHKVTGWAANENDGTVIKSDDQGNFSVIGLDDGTYTLKETKAPAGYNLPEDGFTVKITATTKNDQQWDKIPSSALTDIAVSVNGGTETSGETSTGTVAIKIANTKGSSLPSTGGMGTTVLYAAGAAIVLVAAFGIAFAVRRRNAR